MTEPSSAQAHDQEGAAVICAGCFVALLAWDCQRLGVVPIGLSAVAAIEAGLLTLVRIWAATRLVKICKRTR